MALRRLGQWERSISVLERALVRDPNFVDAWVNLAVGLSDMSRDEEAIAAARRVIELDPNRAAGFNILGHASAQLGRLDEAAEAYRESERLGDPVAAGNRFLLLHSDPAADPQSIFKEHAAWGQHIEQSITRLPHDVVFDPARRLRIGYVSPDFRGHSVSFFIEPILRRHDRAQFEIICYGNVQDRDVITRRLRALPDHFVDIVPLSADEAAERIRLDKIDILVDLAGHTASNRLDVFAKARARAGVVPRLSRDDRIEINRLPADRRSLRSARRSRSLLHRAALAPARRVPLLPAAGGCRRPSSCANSTGPLPSPALTPSEKSPAR